MPNPNSAGGSIAELPRQPVEPGGLALLGFLLRGFLGRGRIGLDDAFADTDSA